MSVQVKGSGTIGGLDEGLVVSGIVTASTQINVGSNIKVGSAGVVTATSFVGSGANLTGIPAQATIANNADNRVITGGSGVNLNGEANLTFDGSNVIHAGSDGRRYSFAGGGSSHYMKFDSTLNGIILNGYGGIAFETNGTNERLRITSAGRLGVGIAAPTKLLDIATSTSADGIRVKSTGNTYNEIAFDANRTNATNHIGRIISNWNGTTVSYISFDTGTDTSNKDDGQIRFHTSASGGSNVERLRIDSSGRLLIGTTTEGHTDADNLTIATSGHTGITLRSGTSSSGNIYFSDGTSGADEYRGMICYQHNDNSMKFFTDGSERMRILSDGDVVIGSYAAEYYESYTISPNHDDGAARTTFSRAPTGNVSIVIAFKNGGGQIGRIEHDHTSCGIFSSSDYRLKENVLSISDGIARLKTLKPYKFNFIADATKTVDGFFAHEVTAVPEAVSGEKDAVDKDGNPDYQVIDHSKLVPLLTAALQEAITKIETLETKVAALEGS